MSNPEVEGTPGDQPVEEPWYAQVSQEDFEAMRETTEQIRQAVAQQQEQQYQQQQQQPQNPYDPEDLPTVAQVQQMIAEANQPLQQFTQQRQEAEAMEQAKDVVSSYASEKGYELDDETTDWIIQRSRGFMPEMVAKYGVNSNRAAEAAIAQASDAVMETIQARNKAYYEQQMNQLQGLRRAPQELPAAQNASPQMTPGQSKGGNERDLVASWFGNK